MVGLAVAAPVFVLGGRFAGWLDGAGHALPVSRNPPRRPARRDPLALMVLGIHLFVSIIPPLAVLASILPRLAPPELLAFGVLTFVALSLRTRRTSPPPPRISHNLDRSLRQAVGFHERATPSHPT